jgi:hypothetical protein
MERFVIANETCKIGFQEHVTLNILKPIYEQLGRRTLAHRLGENKGKPDELKKIIEKNSSLYVSFGWSFESSHFYKIIMDDCIREVIPNFNEHTGQMISDMRCSWLGFVPHNAFEKASYENLNTYQLILFNNELVNFQHDVIRFITQHTLYKQHALLRDDRYRFAVFKSVRKDREALADVYYNYMKAVREVGLINALPRELLEEHIGSHFLYHPDLYFELLEFSLLKGEVYE